MEAQGNFHDFTRWAKVEVIDKIQVALKLKVDPIDATRFVVREEGVEYIVDLKSRTCQCLVFQIDEILCTHAIAAINSRHMNKSSYCSHSFLRLPWLQTYQGEVLLVGNTTSQIVPDRIKDLIIKPPDKEVLLRRRQTFRYPCRTESSRNNYRCSRYLAQLVVENVLAFNEIFWIRLAAREDTCKSDDDKEWFHFLISSAGLCFVTSFNL
ncbi:hypothetical protein P3S68_004137 [Capsicum galapagoense]